MCPLKKDVNNMTNLDKMRTMSPEELGTFLSNLVTIADRIYLGRVVSLRNYDYKEQIQRRKELQKMDFISGVQAGRLIRHFLNTFEPDITVKRFRKRYKELQKDLREDVPHKVLYSSRGTRYYWLQENVLSFLRNRINIKAEVK